MFTSWPVARCRPSGYYRVDVGDVDELVNTLHQLECAVMKNGSLLRPIQMADGRRSSASH